MGGEKTDDHLKGLRDLGSPPRGRGKVAESLDGSLCLRITPAWAGKSNTGIVNHTSIRDHPRMGGEKPNRILWNNFKKGSPPHGRGKVCDIFNCLVCFGITPAWAGKRCVLYLAHDLAGDHPRMGGEKTKKIP